MIKRDGFDSDLGFLALTFSVRMFGQAIYLLSFLMNCYMFPTPLTCGVFAITNFISRILYTTCFIIAAQNEALLIFAPCIMSCIAFVCSCSLKRETHDTFHVSYPE